MLSFRRHERQAHFTETRRRETETRRWAGRAALVTLNLAQNHVTDDALDVLLGMRALRILNLAHTQVRGCEREREPVVSSDQG